MAIKSFRKNSKKNSKRRTYKGGGESNSNNNNANLQQALAASMVNVGQHNNDNANANLQPVAAIHAQQNAAYEAALRENRAKNAKKGLTKKLIKRWKKRTNNSIAATATQKELNNKLAEQRKNPAFIRAERAAFLNKVHKAKTIIGQSPTGSTSSTDSFHSANTHISSNSNNDDTENFDYFIEEYEKELGRNATEEEIRFFKEKYTF
jgi:hypothetical protein